MCGAARPTGIVNNESVLADKSGVHGGCRARRRETDCAGETDTAVGGGHTAPDRDETESSGGRVRYRAGTVGEGGDGEEDGETRRSGREGDM